MKATDLLAKVKVASPCHARWEDMAGDKKSRFCNRCEKHVYNLSAMSSGEVANLIRAKEGKLCGRFYRRADGTMLTSDCPVGAMRVFQRTKALVATALALLVTSLVIKASISYDSRSPGSLRQTKFGVAFNSALWTIKGWLGLNPRPMVMGEICVTPAPSANAAANAASPVNVTTNQSKVPMKNSIESVKP